MRYLFTLVLLAFSSVASAQWTFVDSLKLGGITNASLLAADSSGHLLVYANNFLIYDTATRTWTKAQLPVAAKPYLAVLPSGRVLAGFSKAVYYSDDHCASWNVLGRGMALTSIWGVAWNDTALVAVGNGGVPSGMMVLGKSDSNWISVAHSLPPTTLTEATRTTDGYFVASYGRKIYRSRDPLHWDANDTAKTDAKMTTALVLDNGDILALGQYSSSVYRSEDWGATWSQPLSLPGLNAIRGLYELKNGMAAAMTSSQGFFVTYDYGSSWHQVRYLPVMLASAMTTLAHGDLIVASTSGIYRSLDSGVLWHELDSGWTVGTGTAIGAIGDTAFLSITLRGTYRSYTTPPQWKASNDSLFGGLNGFQVARGEMYGSTTSHLVHWNGSSWSALPNMFEDAQPITYAMSTTGRMFAATSTQFFYLTPDNDWRTVTQLFGLLVKETVADSAGRVYALVGKDSIFYSTDDGENWSELPGRPTPVTVRAMMATGDTLLIATAGGTDNALYTTADLGEHWSSSPYSLKTINGMASYQGRHFVYNSSALLERESQETTWTPTVEVPATEGILQVSISPNGRAYVLTSRGLYTRTLPHVVNGVNQGLRQTQSITVSPNPASVSATIDGAGRYTILDVNGREVSSVMSGRFDCSHYPAGVYTLRSETGETAKLVIVR